MTEEAILNELLLGEYKNFKFLVELYHNRVINISYKFLLNQEDSEDIAQEVFMEIYKSIGKFKKKSELSTWIYRITVSKSLNLIKKRKAKKRFGKVISFFSKENFLLNILSSNKYNPEHHIEKNEKMNLVYEKINELPENQRIAFVMNKVKGIKNNEIAETLNMSVNNVDILIYRARKNLKNKLEEYFL